MIRVLSFSLWFIVLGIYQSSFGYPTGHTEAMMAGAGIALPASPGNSLFNPAGLGFLNTNKLSVTVSGNALEQQRVEFSGLNTSGSSTNLRPTLANTIFPVGNNYASFFVAAPIISKIVQPSNFSLGGTYDVNSHLSMNVNALVGGISYSGLFNPDLAWGIVLGGLYINQEVNSYYVIKNSTSLTTQFTQSYTKYTQAAIFPGLLWKATDWYNLGITVSVATPSMLGSSEYYNSQTTSSTPTTPIETTRSYDPSVTSYYDVGLGQLFKIQNHSILLDVNYESPQEQKNQDNETIKGNDKWNYAIGWRGPKNQRWMPLAGFSYSNNQNTETLLYTLGCSISQRENEVVLGAYFQKDNAQEKGASAQETIGLVFSSQVFY